MAVRIERTISLGSCLGLSILLCGVAEAAAAGGDGDAVRAAESALKGSDVGRQMATIEALRGADGRKAASFLVSATRAQGILPVVSRKASEVLGGLESEEAKECVFERLARDVDNKYLLSAAGRMRIAKARPLFLSVIDSRNSKPAAAAAAARALGRFAEHDERTLERLVALLDPKNFHTIRKAAAEALGGAASPKAFPALLAYLPDRQIGCVVEDALCRLTGQDFGDNPNKWQDWRAANGTGFKPVNTGVDEYRLANAAKLAARKDRSLRDSYFYGLQVDGKNIMFVLDKSGSMQGVKMSRLQRELANLVDALDPDMSFGMLFFGETFDRFPGMGFADATAKSKASARNFIFRVYSEGPTPAESAMQKTFKDVVAGNIDTIYLLSDGKPTKAGQGIEVPPEDVRQAIALMNEDCEVTINTISIGGPSDFLKNVAADGNGRYTEAQ